MNRVIQPLAPLEHYAREGAHGMTADEARAAICSGLMEGISLRTLCARDDMPAMSTVMAWLQRDEVFREQYARAREVQADVLFDEIVDIADRATDRDSAAAARVSMDARKWTAGKLRPKVYGERMEVAVESTVSLAEIIEERRKRVIDEHDQAYAEGRPPPHGKFIEGLERAKESDRQA